MFRKLFCLAVTLFCVSALAETGDITTPPEGKLTAAQIVERNVAARGGLERWRAVKTMVMSGKLEAGGNSRIALPMPGRKDAHFMPPARPAEQARLPFVMELKRPRKVRVEVVFNGESAIQTFDGVSGWKLRPFLNRRVVEPYTQDEMNSVTAQGELDGLLIDYAAKGTSIELVGTEKVDGRDSYKLELKTRSGVVTHVWIDAGTFLETKIEGTPRRLDGRLHPVAIYCHDYRPVQGLLIPFVLETKVMQAAGAKAAAPYPTAAEQIVIEKVQVNPVLEDTLFTKAALDAAALNPAQTNPVPAKPME